MRRMFCDEPLAQPRWSMRLTSIETGKLTMKVSRTCCQFELLPTSNGMPHRWWWCFSCPVTFCRVYFTVMVTSGVDMQIPLTAWGWLLCVLGVIVYVCLFCCFISLTQAGHIGGGTKDLIDWLREKTCISLGRYSCTSGLLLANDVEVFRNAAQNILPALQRASSLHRQLSTWASHGFSFLPTSTGFPLLCSLVTRPQLQDRPGFAK